LDELDLNILGALRRDARKPFLELARELGVSDATIHVRVKRMMEEGIIKGFETIVDDGKLGYDVTAFIEIDVKPGTVADAVAKLSRIDGILEIHEVHGPYDILLKVRTVGLTELRDKLVDDIRMIEEVVSSQTYSVLRVAKEEHSLPLTTKNEILNILRER
jgi:Lrp/AsnC family transcriptional regulator for asnA, asnC and gidA